MNKQPISSDFRRTKSNSSPHTVRTFITCSFLRIVFLVLY